MRKHFLILMLLTLLPLATWAAEYTIKVYPTSISRQYGQNLYLSGTAVTDGMYTIDNPSTMPSATLKAAINARLAYSTEATEQSEVGEYAYRLTFPNGNTYVDGDTYTFNLQDGGIGTLAITKANANVSTPAAAVTGDQTYAPAGVPLLATQAAGSANSITSLAAVYGCQYKATASDDWSPAEAEVVYSEIAPVAANAGMYKVWYKIPGTDNYNATAAAEAGDVTVVKADNAWATTPAIEGWTYGQTASTPAAEVTYDNASITYLYKKTTEDWGDASAVAPTNAGNYEMKATAAATTNYNSLEAIVPFSIAKATPVIVLPDGALLANQPWDGESHDLLSAAATLENNVPGAEITYTYRFKGKNDADYGAWQTEKTSYSHYKAQTAGNYRVNIQVHGSDNWYDASYKVNSLFPVVTISRVDAATSVDVEAVTEGNLTYDGNPKQLLSEAGTATGGTLHYQVKKGNDVEVDWTPTPTNVVATNAGTYTVNYKVVADENHNDSEVFSTENPAIIARADATLGEYAAVEGLVYNAAARTLLTEENAPEHGVSMFSLNGGTTWVDAIPEETNAGNYNVTVKVVSNDPNYKDKTAAATIPVTIEQKSVTISGAEGLPALEYNAQNQDLLANEASYDGAEGGEEAVTFAYTINEVEATDLKAKNAGTYTVAWTAILNPSNNYKTSDVQSGSVEVNIAKKSIGYLLGNKDWTYNGQQATTDGTYAVMAGSFPAGKTLANENIKFEFPGEVINVKEGGYTFGSLTPAKLNEEGEDNLGNYSFIFAGNSTVNVLPAEFEPKDEDITFEPATATFAAENITVVPAIAGMTEDADYTYTVAPATINNAGEYTFTFTGKGNYTDATVEKVFTVAQKNIAADMVQGEGIFDAVAYDGQNHAVAIALKWVKNPEAPEADKEYVNLVEGTDFDVYVNGVKTKSTKVEAINAGDYVYTIKGIGNYAAQLEGEDYTLTINRNDDPEDFAGAFSFTDDTWTEKVYNAASQTPEWSTTLADADYDVIVTDDEGIIADTKAAADALKLKNKGTYTYAFTPTGNYQGEGFVKVFTITPATIAVQAANATKEYNGLDGLAGAEGGLLTYSGIKAPDTEAVVIAPENAISVVPVDEQTKNVGEYNLTVNVDDFTSENDNYEFVAANQQGKLTITKKTGVVINFTAETKKDYGVADDDADLKANLIVAGVIEGEEAEMLDEITVTRREGAAYQGENVGTYENALQINLAEDALPFSNYTINYAQNYGTLVIDAPEAIVIALKDETKFNKMYDGKVPADWEVSPEDLIVSGGLANPEPLDPSIITKKPIAKVQNASANVGTYVIKLEGAETDNYPVVAIDGKMVISAKKLAKGSVSIQEQTLQAGTDITNFDEDAFEVKNLVGDEDYTAIWGIKLTDAHKADGKVAGTTDEAGIQLYVIDEVAAANYEFDAAEKLAGRLVVPSATSIFLTRGDRATQSIEDGANNIFTGNKNHTNVEFDSFAMDAKKWYAMVLPFDANMSQFIQAFGGYVAVDVLDESNTNTSKMNFELNGATVPAHTPFLIKLFEPTNLNTVKFVDVNVEETKGANTTLTDAANNELIGTYAGKKFNGDNENCWILSLNSGKWQAASATATVYPLGAYIHTATANARIFVQEEDGTVTEIESINADGSAVEAGTYYTVNGMKLDKAPTKKGVYVKDGKKVVVK